MSTPILARIARQLGDGAIDALARLAPRDLTSLFLHLLAARAAKLTAPALVAAAADPFFVTSPNDARRNHAVRGALLDAAAGFDAVEIAPVVPLGATRLLGAIHPNNVLGAVRGAELVGDTSAALALEAVRRRRRGDRAVATRLCGAHRCFRLPYPETLLPHFGLFAAVTAQRAGDEADDADELRAHLALYLRALRALGGAGYRFRDVTVAVSDTRAVERRLAAAGVDRAAARVRTGVFGDPDERLAALGATPLRGSFAEVGDARLAVLAERVVAPLAAEFPEATVQLDLGRLEGLGYYQGPCVRVVARDPSGLVLPLVDGGFLGWTRLLLGDRRERLLATGMGIDLVPLRFRAGS